MSQPAHLVAGRRAEAIAEAYLVTQGLSLVTRNFRGKTGEIDLVMKAGTTLVFVEVRHRRGHGQGGGLASIDRGKRRKLIATARWYLLCRRLGDRTPCRFDVVIVSGNLAAPELSWLANAFDLNDV